MDNPFLGLRTCIYKVSDINKATEWYSEALYSKPYFAESFYVGFDVRGYELGLQPEEEADDNSKGENVLTYWGVENIESEYNRLLKLGATEHQKPYNVGGDVSVATLKDPWQNIIGIIYNPDFQKESVN